MNFFPFDLLPRFAALLGFALFIVLHVVVRSWIHTRRYGSSGLALLHPVNALQVVQGVSFLLVVLIVFGEALAAAWWPQILVAIPGVHSAGALAVIQPIGAILMLAGIIAVFVAQLDLGASWRAGIDQDARPGLVTDGLYRFCRNPIYLFGFLELTAFLLLLPNLLMLTLAVATVIGVRHGVALEERYLLDAYGDSYRAYAGRVGRFLPGLGRLA